MIGSTILQATTGFTVDVSSLATQVVLIVAAVVIIAVGALGIYYAATKMSDAINADRVARDRADTAAAFATQKQIIAEAKADLLSDFDKVLDIDRSMREKQFLIAKEESALKT